MEPEKEKNHKNKLLLQLNKETFWNCDLKSMDYIKNKKAIIKRIIQNGTENDEKIMWKLYAFETIKNVAINIDNMDKDRLLYISFVLKTKEKEFKCYKNKQFQRIY